MDKIHKIINEALSLHQKGQIREAIDLYKKVLPLQAKNDQLLYLLGTAFAQIGENEKAIDFLEKSLKVNAGNPFALNNLGNLLRHQKKFDDAVGVFDKAIVLKRDYVDAYCNRGVALHEMRKFNGAIESYDRALAIRENFAEAHYNRGLALHELQKLDLALGSYKRAIEINPNFDFLPGRIVNLSMHLCEWEVFGAFSSDHHNKILGGHKFSDPLSAVGFTESPLLQRKVSEVYSERKFPSGNLNITHETNLSERRIRIGYFSADFHDHATMHLITEMFEMHDRRKFEVFGFSLGQITNDEWQKRAMNSFDHFIDCRTESDLAIAELSRSLGVEIAVDLKGFTKDARQGIFSFRAAPIQVNFLGFPGTMGAPYFDYIIADEVVIPEKNRSFFREKIAYLPDCYQPNCRNRRVSGREFARTEIGLPADAFVFCSFNSQWKITPEMFSVWMRILKAADNSVLWIMATNATAQRNLIQEAARRGVAANRIVFAERVSVEDHLKRLEVADLMLDTFPCGGHTTCSDALRIGLPVVTLLGESFASRVAASLLKTVGLPELIAVSLENYENLAIRLAKNQKELDLLGDKLRENVKVSPLFNPERFSRNIESLFEQMIQRHRNGKKPNHLWSGEGDTKHT